MDNQTQLSFEISETLEKHEWQTPKLEILFTTDTKGKSTFFLEYDAGDGRIYGSS